nr:NSP2 [Bat RVJ-like rotavirus BtSY2]
MSLSVSLADFITKTEDGYVASDTSCEALDRFVTKEEKQLKDKYYNPESNRSEIRKQLFLLPSCKKRLTQKGVVPVKELRSGVPIPAATRKLITDWLLEMFNDDEANEQIEKHILEKFPDVLCSADKISRVAQRLEDPSDLIHSAVSFQTLAATFLACNSTIATEGACTIVRATEDAIICKFEPIPEHLAITRARSTFYKAFPVTKNEPMIYGIKAMSGLSGRDFIMNHGHGHLRTVPFIEIAGAIRSFSKKSKEEINKIRSDPLTPNAGERFLSMLDMLFQGEKIDDIIKRTMKFDKKSA